jgi:GNAT superfamily N-acetyltransferase
MKSGRLQSTSLLPLNTNTNIAVSGDVAAAFASDLKLAPTTLSDTDAIVRIAAATGVFTPDELICLRCDIEECLSPDGDDDWMFTLRRGDDPVGFVHFGPVPISDRGMMLFWIFVAPEARGLGAADLLVQVMESQLRQADTRIVFIETSDTPDFAPACRFYRKSGYDQVCIVPEYYGAGIGKVIFSKVL